jgi:hypothetical protein
MSNEQKPNPNQNHPAAQKPAETSKLSIDAADLKAALAEALTKGIAEGMAMAQMAADKNRPAAQVHPRMALQARTLDPCPECRQDKKGCKGRHTKVVVYPRDGRWARYFQGVTINGINYRSSNSSHKIVVPANADIARLVAEWENNEIEVSSGRKREHKTGHVSSPNTNVPYFR